MRTTALLLLALAACGKSPPPGVLKYDNWYPASIAAPPGTKYPCEVSPLPADLSTFPAEERCFINHSTSLLLRAVHERLKAWEGLRSGDASTFESYATATRALCEKLKAEWCPDGMEPYRAELLQGIDLQVAWFKKAYPAIRAGTAWKDLIAMPEGHEASGKLVSAWGLLDAHCASGSPEAKRAVYQHL